MKYVMKQNCSQVRKKVEKLMRQRNKSVKRVLLIEEKNTEPIKSKVKLYRKRRTST